MDNAKAAKAALALVKAYKAAEESGSVNWEDIDEAHRLALEAVENAGEAVFVTEVMVTDPDSKGEVSLGVYKDPVSGGLFGIDSSFIEHNDGEDILVVEPFNGTKVRLAETTEGSPEVSSEFEEEIIEEIVGNHPEYFDAVEIQGVREGVHPQDGDVYCEVVHDHEKVQFYSIYLHHNPEVSPKDGVECVTDRKTHKGAVEFAEYLAKRLGGLEVHDFSPPRREKVIVFGYNMQDQIEFRSVTVEVTPEQYDLGEHYDKAEVCAMERGLPIPFICYDRIEAESLISAAETMRNMQEVPVPGLGINISLVINESGKADVFLGNWDPLEEGYELPGGVRIEITPDMLFAAARHAENKEMLFCEQIKNRTAA